MPLITRFSYGAIGTLIPYTQPVAALPLYTSGLGWELKGGAFGTRIHHIHVEAILITANDTYVWHVLAFRGGLPRDTTRYQGAQALQTYPLPPASQYDLDILYYSTLRPSRPAVGEVLYPLIADFDDDTGPAVGEGETLSVMILPCFVVGAAPPAGAQAFISASVFGGDKQTGAAREMTARSLAPSALR